MNDDYIEDYRDFHKMFSFEGDKGVERFSDLLSDMGYPGHQFRFGSPVESFLSDNPGAIDALLEWIEEQNIEEWKDGLLSTVPLKEEEYAE